MHFTWDISFGQILLGLPLLGILGALLKIFGILFKFRVEHETLMGWWARSQSPPVNLNEIPTRQGKWW